MLPIHQISLPTPWPSVGPIHVYLIRQEPVTLIDAGLHTPESWEALQNGLRGLNLTVRDISRVLITHAHLDHMGQAGRIAAESGAEVFLHPDEVGKAETPEWWRIGRDRVLREAGVPADTQQQMDLFWQMGRRMTLPLDRWTPLADGQRFAFESGALTAFHLPGHALGHTAFYEEETRTLMAGDHLLEKVTPNPLLEPVRPGHPAAVPHDPIRALTLGQFLASLKQVSAMPVEKVFPAHGPVITDHKAVAAAYAAKHEKRLESLLSRLGSGIQPWELTRQVYPRVREFDLFLALSEVLAHLDLLVVRGKAHFETDGTASRYVPAAPGIVSAGGGNLSF